MTLEWNEHKAGKVRQKASPTKQMRLVVVKQPKAIHNNNDTADAVKIASRPKHT